MFRFSLEIRKMLKQAQEQAQEKAGKFLSRLCLLHFLTCSHGEIRAIGLALVSDLVHATLVKTRLHDGLEKVPFTRGKAYTTCSVTPFLRETKD